MIVRRSNDKGFDLCFDPRSLAFAKVAPGAAPAFDPLVLSASGCGSAGHYRLRVEITWTCNARCSYCLVFGNLDNPSGAMRIETAERLLADFARQLPPGSAPSMIILGGEPLTNPDTLYYLVEKFPGCGHVITNGTLVTRAIARHLAAAGATVYVSFDGPTAEHNRERVFANGEPLYAKAVKGYETLREAGVATGVLMVASPETVDWGANMVIETARRFHPVEIGYSLPHWSRAETTVTSPAAYGRALAELVRRRDELVSPVMQLAWRFASLLSGKPRMAACPMATNQVTYLPDGRPIRCAKVDLDDELARIPSEAIRAATPLLQDGNACETCIGVGVCGGGCPFDGMRRFGELRDLRECEVLPQLVDAVLDLVFEGAEALPHGPIAPSALRAIVGGTLYAD